MYINLVLGVVAVLVIWFYIRKLFSGNGRVEARPAQLLLEEMEQRRALEVGKVRNFERLEKDGHHRLAPLVHALEDMQANVPEFEERVAWTEDNGEIVVSGKNAADGPVLRISWKMPHLDLQRTGFGTTDISGEYVFRNSSGKEERYATYETCVAKLVSFIVDIME